MAPPPSILFNALSSSKFTAFKFQVSAHLSSRPPLSAPRSLPPSRALSSPAFYPPPLCCASSSRNPTFSAHPRMLPFLFAEHLLRAPGKCARCLATGRDLQFEGRRVRQACVWRAQAPFGRPGPGARLESGCAGDLGRWTSEWCRAQAMPRLPEPSDG